jgi:Holliday junction resolvase RusA-like endonuclease
MVATMSEPLVSFTVLGIPVPKGRPRFRIVKPRGKPQFVTVYSPSETVAYEKLVADGAWVAMGVRAPLEGALTVLVEAFMPVPASWSKKRQAAALAGEVHHVSKPDCDNLGKISADSVNKIVFVDDSQIVSMTVIKTYAEVPRLRVTVWAFDDVEPEQKEMI